jgi:hypothetical protein
MQFYTFGWSADFVAALVAHASGQRWPGRGEGSVEYRARMRLRLTDQRVAELAGRIPLSVAFDKLGPTAARWAHLADAWQQAAGAVNEEGRGWWPRST